MVRKILKLKFFLALGGLMMLSGCMAKGKAPIESGAVLPASEKGIVFLAISGDCQGAAASIKMRKGSERLDVKVEPGFFARSLPLLSIWPGMRADVNVARFDLLPGDYQIEAVYCVESSGTRTLKRPYSSNGIASFTAGSNEVIDAGLFVATPNTRTVSGLFGPYQASTGTAGFRVIDMSPSALEVIRTKYPEEASRMKKQHMAIDSEHLKEIGQGQCILEALRKNKGLAKEKFDADLAQCNKKFELGSRKIN